MIASERKRYIMQQLHQKGIINLKVIARELGTSEITIRRDLEKLEKEGRLRRVQGGASLGDGSESLIDEVELTLRGKGIANRDAKESAANAAAAFVKDGDSVFLDSGTSMIPLMKVLEKKRVKIVTYNQLLVGHIREPLAEIFMIGGQYHPRLCMNVGPSAENIIRDFYFDKSFISCSGVDFRRKMAYTTAIENMLMKKTAIENSDKCYLLLDHSKVDKKSFLKLTETSAFDRVVCGGKEGHYDYPLPPNVIFTP